MNRRLTESEVKSIFACVMDNKGPAENIAFKIIKTQNNKPMLSPPALELEGESDRFLPPHCIRSVRSCLLVVAISLVLFSPNE